MPFVFCAKKRCIARGVHEDPRDAQRLWCDTHSRTAARPVSHQRSGGKRRHCATDGCTLLPSFGDPTTRYAANCSKHRQLGHINLRAPYCTSPGCVKTASYSSPRGKAQKYCSEHSPPGYIHKSLRRECGGRVVKRAQNDTAGMPVDTPVDMPVDTPVDTPVDMLVDMPVDMPVDTPAEASAADDTAADTAADDAYLRELWDSALFDAELEAALF
jgi:hypothetical protein